MKLGTGSIRIVFLVAFMLMAVVPGMAGPFDATTIEVTDKASADESSAAVEAERDAFDPALATGVARPRITGAFLQLWGCDNDNSPEYWRKELEAMRAIGMRIVIPQYAKADGTDLTPATEAVLNAADELNMRVFVGTMLDENGWYTNKVNPFFLAKERKKVAEYTRELVKRFAGHKSFYGLYIPYEDNTLSLPGSMGEFYGAIAEAARAEKPGLKVLISPYTTPRPGMARSLPTWLLSRYFKTMLAKAKVDIVAWQDGVGGTTAQIDRIAHDLAPIAAAARALNIEIWGNCEVFHRTSPLSQDFAAEATSMDILSRQIEGEAPYVDRLICFDFNHYFSPRLGDKAEQLYNEYRAWIGLSPKAP